MRQEAHRIVIIISVVVGVFVVSFALKNDVSVETYDFSISHRSGLFRFHSTGLIMVHMGLVHSQ